MSKERLMSVIAIIIFSSILISATEINIGSIKYEDRFLREIPIINNTGDRLIVDISVIEPQENDKIIMAWGSSWVDCLRNPDVFNYRCIMTVTPYMNGKTEVVIKINGLFMKDVGSYVLNGQLFPEYLPPVKPIVVKPKRIKVCETIDICKSYQRECNKICARLSRNGEYCYQYKNICKTTDVCLRYKPKTTCRYITQ